MVSGTVDFEPTTVAFVRNWCMYAGADVAGTSGIPYQTNAWIMRLMCSGAADPVFVLKSVVDGADDVLIGGCHPGDCDYREGDFKARSRVETQRDPQACGPRGGSGLAAVDRRQRGGET